MLKIIGNDVNRAGEKIGYIHGNDIFNHDGVKMGYFSSNDIYNHEGRKVGYLDGDYIKTMDGSSIRIEENRSHVSGGTYSDLHRAAVRLLLGD